MSLGQYQINFFFFFIWMGTRNGHIAPFLESAFLKKRKRRLLIEIDGISTQDNVLWQMRGITFIFGAAFVKRMASLVI